jgi:hypothetical protein
MVTIGREVAEPFDQPFALDHHFLPKHRLINGQVVASNQ